MYVDKRIFDPLIAVRKQVDGMMEGRDDRFYYVTSESVTAVSYTHLDVYKRQSQDAVDRFIPTKWKNTRIRAADSSRLDAILYLPMCYSERM